MKQQEKLQIFLQYLNNHGYNQTATKLIEQTNLKVDQSVLLQITDMMNKSNYEGLEILFNNYMSKKKTIQCMYLIMKNKYIQLLDQHKINEAIILLRDRIPKYFLDAQQKKQLTDMILETIFQPLSDAQIINEILNLCHQEINIIQPNRLQNIIQQAQTNKILECPHHSKLNDDYLITKNHTCKHKIIKEIKLRDYKTFQYINIISSLIEYSNDLSYQIEVANKNGLIITQQYIDCNGKLIQNELFILNEHHKLEIQSISISPCNQFIGTTSKDETVVFDLNQKKKILKLNFHQGLFQDMVWFNNQNKQSDQIHDNHNNQADFYKYNIWTITSNGWLSEWDFDKMTYTIKTEEFIKIMRYSNQKDQLTIASTNKFSIYSLQQKKQLHSISLDFDIDSVKINSTQEFLIALNQKNYFQFLYYTIPKLELIKQFNHLQQQINSAVSFDIGWHNENFIVLLIKNPASSIIWHRQKGQQPIIEKKMQNQLIQMVRINPLNNVIYFYAIQQNRHYNFHRTLPDYYLPLLQDIGLN